MQRNRGRVWSARRWGELRKIDSSTDEPFSRKHPGKPRFWHLPIIRSRLAFAFTVNLKYAHSRLRSIPITRDHSKFWVQRYLELSENKFPLQELHLFNDAFRRSRLFAYSTKRWPITIKQSRKFYICIWVYTVDSAYTICKQSSCVNSSLASCSNSGIALSPTIFWWMLLSTQTHINQCIYPSMRSHASTGEPKICCYLIISTKASSLFIRHLLDRYSCWLVDSYFVSSICIVPESHGRIVSYFHSSRRHLGTFLGKNHCIYFLGIFWLDMITWKIESTHRPIECQLRRFIRRDRIVLIHFEFTMPQAVRRIQDCS